MTPFFEEKLNISATNIYSREQAGPSRNVKNIPLVQRVCPVEEATTELQKGWNDSCKLYFEANMEADT